MTHAIYCSAALSFLVTAPAFSRASGEELVRRWEFKTTADVAGWTPSPHVKDLNVVKDVLRITLTGPDAYLILPPVEAPLDGCVLRVRMRSGRGGDSQVYWATADDPVFSERKFLTLVTPSSGPAGVDLSQLPFATYEFPIGKPGDQGRKLIAVRIDTYNNNSEGTVEMGSVELVRVPAVLDVNFSAAQHQIGLGRPVAAQIGLRHTGGRAPEGPYDITLPGDRKARATLDPQAPRPGVELTFDRPGVQYARAAVASAAGKPLYDLETSIIAGKEGTLPIVATMGSDRVRLDLIPTATGQSVGAARWMVAVHPGEWKLAGWLPPLAQLAVARSDGQVVLRQPPLQIAGQWPDFFRLTGEVEEDGRRIGIEVDFALANRDDLEGLNISAILRGGEGTRLLEFSGPILRADRDPPGNPLERFAVFGGLEFLEPGWPSSGDRAVGHLFADRWSPHPYKIALPAMAVEAGGLTTSLMWKPRSETDSPDAMPAATFASPNFLDGQPNHLMKLAIPSIPRWRQENENLARTPYVMDGGWLEINYVLHAEPDLPAGLVARRWYEIFNPPPPPRRPHDDKATYDLIARNFGDTMWWPEEKGWRHHWYHSEKTSGYAPDMAAEIIAHAIKTGRNEWLEKTGLKGRAIIDAAGTLASRLAGDAHARNLIASMRPDGTWPFVNTPQMREQTRQFTHGKYDSLGEDGSTSLGTCVQGALPILRYAQISGDAKCIEAGLTALQAMRRFRVPRGAQVWEVHQEIPDIRAAALAVEAFQIGYRMTCDRSYLEDASYWAWTGVPFIYSWRVPIDRIPAGMVASRSKNELARVAMPASEGFECLPREVMPYGSVPVLGPTFYVINWFGVVVQWCGLEWAEKVIELDADQPDPMLRYIADGVVLSGLNQMFDKPPWVGLYPDVWDVQQNTATGALIYAGLPLRCLQAQSRVPPWTATWTQVLRNDLNRLQWHVSGWGSPPKKLPAPNPVIWSVRLAYPPSQPNELLLAGVPAPKRVLVGETVLDEHSATDRPGWRYLSEKRAAVIRFVSPDSGEANVRIEW